MVLQKLESTDAFVVRDLDAELPAIGIVRSANKILQGGAKELARSQTYQCAALGMQVQGASCGINAAPEARDAAVEAFCTELLPAAEQGGLMIDAAKGVPSAQLATLNEADQRSGFQLQMVDGVINRSHLLGVGAVAAATAAKPLEGTRVAIENFDETGLAVARQAAAAGASITAVSTSAGAAVAADGQSFSLDELSAGLAASGADLVGSLIEEPLPFWRILGADVDVLFAGSKAGLIDHKGAENVKASLLVPTGPIPYTTKAALVLEAAGTTVLPDFVTTAGQLIASFPESDDQAAVEASVRERITSLVNDAIGKDASPILEACFAAEAFLSSWRDELPFGRPFA